MPGLKQKLILYIDISYTAEVENMNLDRKGEEIREKVIIAMLEEFPALKKKIRKYLEQEK